jgi:hypothetical protein
VSFWDVFPTRYIFKTFLLQKPTLIHFSCLFFPLIVSRQLFAHISTFKFQIFKQHENFLMASNFLSH